jgi:hypothetical protein
MQKPGLPDAKSGGSKENVFGVKVTLFWVKGD